MSIEKLDEDLKLPFEEAVFTSEDPAQIAAYMLKLVETLQGLLRQNANVTNFNIDLNDGEAIYYQLKSSDGTYPKGSWRRIRIGDNLEDQVLLNGNSLTGTWTTAQVRERPL